MPTGSLSNSTIEEHDQSSKMVLYPEDGKLKDPDKSLKEGGMNVLMTPSPMDGKLGPEVKVGKKVKIFLKVGSFKFNKKGKFKEREQIEIRRTSHNIFDGFNNSSKNIVKVATHKEDASKDLEKEKILMKINLKR